MLSTSAFAETAALVGDPARASMLTALMDGRALTASELARVAGVMPQTASGHLARLSEAGLLTVERQGRHHYHRLASPLVAQMLESIMAVTVDHAAGDSRRTLMVGPRNQSLRRARTCYDHLAGQLAVAIADRMVERQQIDFSLDGGAVTRAGTAFLAGLGFDLDGAASRAGRRSAQVFCRPCLDWSERRPHIAGALGVALCRELFARRWLRRLDGTRAVSITPVGQRGFYEAFGIRVEK